jgi:diguanylate cyclase (GGDEF)-like protein
MDDGPASGSGVGWISAATVSVGLAVLTGAAVASYFQRRYRNLTWRAERLKLIERLSHRLGSALELDEIARIVTSEVGRLIHGDRASLALCEPESGCYRVSVSRMVGTDAVITETSTIPLDDPQMRNLPRTREPLIYDRTDALPPSAGARLREQGVGSGISVPILTDAGCIGILNLASRRPGAFSQDDLHVLTEMADHVAVAAGNAHRYQETARQKAAVEELARTDALTGLHNRQYFEELFRREIERVRRYRNRLALAMIDIDDFKSINDTLGHRAGDEVLKVVGRVLASYTRASDFAGRLGGDEFVVAMPETTRDGAAQAAAKWRAALVEAYERDEVPVPVRLSIGIAGGEPGECADLLETADERMYEQKRGHSQPSREGQEPDSGP